MNVSQRKTSKRFIKICSKYYDSFEMKIVSKKVNNYKKSGDMKN
jgi:hypothetical protein